MSEITQSQKTALLKLPGFKEIQKQYAKETQSGSGKKRRMRGMGFWGDVGNWFNQAGKDINQFLKDSKIVSNIAAYALPILGAMGGAMLTVNPLGGVAGGIAGKSTADYIRSQGYGYVNQLSQVRPMKMLGRGMIYSQNGMLVKQPVQSGGRMSHMMPDGRMMKGKMHGGSTTVFNTVSTEFSKVQF